MLFAVRPGYFTAESNNSFAHQKIFALHDVAAGCIDLTRFDRIRLHLRCLIRDHKYRWHFGGRLARAASSLNLNRGWRGRTP